MAHPNYEVLEDLATGKTLDRSSDGIREHVAGCQECLSWIDTYELLSQGLTSRSDGAEHPSSEKLARYAAEPEHLGSTERQRLDDHLRGCHECRQHLALATQAIANAQEPGGRVPSARTFPSPVQLALAASLLLLLGLAWALRPAPSHTETVVAEEVSGESFSGTHLVEATDSITADAVTVESGGNVTFRAGESVVLNNGFAVGNGAVFQVEIGPASSQTSG